MVSCSSSIRARLRHAEAPWTVLWNVRRFGCLVKTMLGLMAKKPQLGVVVDQVSTPTWARGLAQTIWAGVQHNVSGGIYHWSDAGVASWYD